MKLLRSYSKTVSIAVRKSLDNKDESVLLFGDVGEIQKEDDCIILYDCSGAFLASIPTSYIVTRVN